MYKKYIKRLFDFILSLCALIVFSPLLIVLSIIGVVQMKGNPFFTQERPGYKEKVFKLIKFRTMTNEKDKAGNLLPDEVRLNGYGRILRATSLDELPELINIVKGDMSIVGPRPLMVSYLKYYTEDEKHRHDVRPGLTGLAQVNGRSFITWEEIFEYDLQYVENISLRMDIKILFLTLKKVFKKEDIADVATLEFDDEGKSYVQVGEKKLRIHLPLDVERREKDVK